MRAGSALLGRRVGGSTGTNLWGAFGLIAAMLAERRTGSVVTLICDPGDRYADTYYADDWVAAQGLDLTPHLATIDRFLASGAWPA
jgi:cysteine synthase A